MDANDPDFWAMHNYTAQPTLSAFNVDLIEKKLADSDNLVRSYLEKCEEIKQIRQNFESFTESAQQIQQMYTNENAQNKQLQNENAELKQRLNAIQEQLAEIENQRVNNDTLNQQIIAKHEDQSQKNEHKYLELCELFVKQGSILHANNLSTTELSRKCASIKDELRANGIPFEWSKSPSKQQRRTGGTDKTKAKITRTLGTQLERNEFCDTPKKMCDKSTQHQPTKATRSTCTSAFISKIDTGVNTENNAEPANCLDANVDSILRNMMPFPANLSPIHKAVAMKASTSTQTKVPEYRTQETLTTINNVRKRIDYVSGLKTDAFHELKEEYEPPPPQIVPQSQSMMLRHMVFYLMTTANLLPLFNNTPEVHTELWLLIEKFIRDKAKFSANDENLHNDEVPASKRIDSDDEYSRDSVESYNSAKVEICKIRDLSNFSPELDENTSGQCINNQRIFIPISPLNPTVKNGTNKSFENGTELVTPSPQIKPNFTNANAMDDGSLLEKLPQIPKKTPCCQAGDPNDKNSPMHKKNDERHTITDAAHFKVPKRKSSTTTPGPIKKMKTTAIVSDLTMVNCDYNLFTKQTDFDFQSTAHLQGTFASLFGDFSETEDEDIDEDRIQSILNSFKTPTMLSPIKEWPSDRPTQSSNKTPSNGFERLKLTNENELYTLNIERQRVCNATTNLNGLLLRPTATNVEATMLDNEGMESLPMLQVTEESSHVKEDRVFMVIPDDFQKSSECQSHLKTSPSPVLLDPLPLPIVQDTIPSLESKETKEIQQIETKLASETVIEPFAEIDISDKEDIHSMNDSHHDQMVEFDDFSPASPKPDDQLSTENPPEIPIDTILNETRHEEALTEQSNVSTESVLDQIIYNYKASVRNQIQISTAKFSTEECYLMACLRNSIEKYCLLKQWTSASITDCTEQLLKLTQRPKYLATAILEVVEDTKEDLSMELTPPAPALQASHQKCLMLVVRVAQAIPSFDKYLEFELDRRLFTFTKEKSVTAMTNLAHFYIALIDIEQPTDLSKIRFFIYKCLYYFKTSAVPLVFAVLMAHQHALPHANSVELLQDPMILAIVSSLSNITYLDSENNGKLFKKKEMFNTLKRLYGFFADQLFPTEGVIEYCVDCLRNNRLKHVDYALILIAKRQDCEYAVAEIIKKHLIPMLIQYFSMDLNVTVEHDEKIQSILFIVGSIVKTFPVEQNINGFLDIFVKCLNSTQRQSIQEAAILAICQLNRFGTHQIYQHLKNWKPNYQISTQIQATLNTIVYRKSRPFWFSSGKY